MATEEQIDAALAAYNFRLSETITCFRCQGRGYHHGFGERGHDPDWCEVCGGPGVIGVADERDAMKYAIEAAEAKSQ